MLFAQDCYSTPTWLELAKSRSKFVVSAFADQVGHSRYFLKTKNKPVTADWGTPLEIFSAVGIKKQQFQQARSFCRQILACTPCI
jgi:hypothetical protein